MPSVMMSTFLSKRACQTVNRAPRPKVRPLT
jgi:hypothetical protein